MNPTAIAYALELITSLPSLISAGAEVLDLLEKGKSKLEAFAAEDRDPTDAEWNELNASIAEKRAELHGT
jgi:hypothetical protein